MPNEPDVTVVPTNDGSDGGSPSGSPQSVTPAADGTAPVTYTAEQYNALQQKFERTNGQVSALQKKINDSIKGRVTQTPAQPEGDGDDPTAIVYQAMNLAGAEIRNKLENEIIPLYDGSNPEYQDQPTLPPDELSRIRRNPWAFVSLETQRYVLKSGDLSPAMLEIEQAMADRAEALAQSNPKPTPKIPAKDINPNPVPAGTPPQEETTEDLWNMSDEELEKRAQDASKRLRA